MTLARIECALDAFALLHIAYLEYVVYSCTYTQIADCKFEVPACTVRCWITLIMQILHDLASQWITLTIGLHSSTTVYPPCYSEPLIFLTFGII